MTSDGSAPDRVAEWAVSVMEALGGPGAGMVIALENLFPPLPSEAILPLAGFAASRGTMTLAEALAWTTTGSLIGALALYGLGAALGRQRVRRAWQRLPLVRIEDLDRTEAWFDRHGRKAVFFGRMLPIFRSLISVPAGVHRMSVPVFACLTLAGSVIWNTAFVLAGYMLGEQWHHVQTYAGAMQLATVLVTGGAVLWWIGRRVRRRVAKKAGLGGARKRTDGPGRRDP
jgi:membrane protein DedA with SNARE-associated domain